MNGSNMFRIATKQYDPFYVQFIFQNAKMIQSVKYLTSFVEMHEKSVELLVNGVKVCKLKT